MPKSGLAETTAAEMFEHARTLQGGGETPAAVMVRQGPVAPGTFPLRYQPECVLGEGGMGAVVLFQDRQIGRRVALKLMKADAAANPNLRDRFMREAQVQGQLEHPSIVPVYDIGADPTGAPYFIMKRVRGVTLAEILDGQIAERGDFAEKYPRRRLLSAFASVCLAIDFAHRHGVVHRDLKPANLMLGDFGEVYVLDWGVAKLHGAAEAPPPDDDMAVRTSASLQTRAGVVLGTPGYMAPEQLRGELDVAGPALDVYSLGAILFELLTLECLHPTTTPEAAIASTLAGADARPSVRAPHRDVAPELEAICVKATALDPADRYASARELHDAVESWLGGEIDLELRRRLATSHAKAAADAADRAATAGASDMEARREAMREIGRALALDPSNEAATRAMMRLLDQPPSRLPPEVGVELDRAERDKTRKLGRFGAIAYASIFGYVPLVVWMGVRSVAAIVAIFAFVGAACALSAMASASKTPPPRLVLAIMLASNVGFALTAMLFGPLLFMPGAIAVNTNAFVAHIRREDRWIVIAMGLLAVSVPFLLQAAGIVPASYEFTGRGMLVVPGALTMTPMGTTVFLAVSAVALVLISALSVTAIRDALGDAERRLLVHAWHMRELAPTKRIAAPSSTRPSRRS